MPVEAGALALELAQHRRFPFEGRVGLGDTGELGDDAGAGLLARARQADHLGIAFGPAGEEHPGVGIR